MKMIFFQCRVIAMVVLALNLNELFLLASHLLPVDPVYLFRHRTDYLFKWHYRSTHVSLYLPAHTDGSSVQNWGIPSYSAEHLYRYIGVQPKSIFLRGLIPSIGMAGFEPAISRSRTARSTSLSHIPMFFLLYMST